MMRLSRCIFGLGISVYGIMNTVATYIGWNYLGSKELEFYNITARVIWALLCFWLASRLFIEDKCSRKCKILICIMILFYLVSYSEWYWDIGPDSELDKSVVFFLGAMCPAFFAGVYGGLDSNKYHFFQVLEGISIVIIPLAFLYIAGLFGINTCAAYVNIEHRNIGILSYMNLSYSFMPYLIAHVIGFVENSNNNMFSDKLQGLRYIAILIYTAALVLCATRGTIVCISVFLFALCMLTSLAKCKEALKKRRLMPAIFVSISILGMIMLGVANTNSPLSFRFNKFLVAMPEGRLDTTTTMKTETLDKEEVDAIVQGSKRITDIDNSEAVLSNRSNLYSLAISEFFHRPWCGMGAGGFWTKYGITPHNYFLEILCDKGLLGGMVFVFFFVVAFQHLAKARHSCEEYVNIVPFFLAYVCYEVISGEFWIDHYMLLWLGYGISERKYTQGEKICAGSVE